MEMVEGLIFSMLLGSSCCFLLVVMLVLRTKFSSCKFRILFIILTICLSSILLFVSVISIVWYWLGTTWFGSMIVLVILSGLKCDLTDVRFGLVVLFCLVN